MENNKDIHALESIDELDNYNNYIYRKILRHIQTGTNLDFGCGFGNFLKFVKSETNLSFEGYEVNSTAIEKLRKENIPYVENIKNSKKYDNIVSINVLEHIENDTKILKELSKIIKPGGKLILYLPHSMILWTKLDSFVDHHRRYTRKDLFEKLKKSNFEIDSVEYVDFIGSLVLIIFKILRVNPNYSKNRLIFYDRSVFKVFKFLDVFTRKIFGKNILVVANVKT